MSDITHSDELVTKQDLSDFYQGILPYLGGIPEALADKFDRANIYELSTEKIVGGWLGKPLYQKTLSATLLSGASASSVKENVVSIGASIDKGFICSPSFLVSSSGVEVALNATTLTVFTSNNVTEGTCAWVVSNSSSSNKNSVIIRNSVPAWSGASVYVTVCYTKTTDSANSFNCANESDYSISEKIIGTWIDRKLLYQKTVSCGQLPSAGAFKDVDTAISGTVQIINIFGWMYRSSDSVTLPLPCAKVDVSFRGSNNKIRLGCYEDYTSFATSYITLQYTKS